LSRAAYNQPVVDAPPDRNRRFVLVALACLVPSPACFLFPTTAPAPPPLLPPMPVPEAIAALGRRYLAAYPDEANRETLQRILHLEPSDSADSAATQLPRIDAAIRRDLADRNLVHIEGWQLTRTECRLYAALALS
jgi:hypothetical protein